MDISENITEYTLVIAEKPSVAESIAKVIGANGKKNGYFEGNGYLVSWCRGHLVGLAAADQYDPRYSKWIKEDLPVLPDPWKFTVFKETEGRFIILKDLMNRKDVTCLINACDAGREGELIFRLLYNEAGCRKPFKRLWISSMEDKAIDKGFSDLKDGHDYDSLYEAALCRAKADWLVGINATRFFTVLHNGKTLNIGRVMTPVLALLTEREKEISEFKKEKFYTVELDVLEFYAESERIDSKTEAQNLRKACIGKPVTVKQIDKNKRREAPPKLYDLTDLQKEANRIYGYTAQQTLDYIQALYEKGLSTYPRTDSNYLTEDMADSLFSLYSSMSDIFSVDSELLKEIDEKQVIDDSRVTDHHAILPTNEAVKADIDSLPSGERNILLLIVRQFLCAVCPYRYVCLNMTVTFECEGRQFISKCSTELEEGWKKISRAFERRWGNKPKDENMKMTLPELSEGEVFTAKAAALKQGSTRKPERYTDAHLLGAMENAGEKMSDGNMYKGLGTSATRAGVIEKLVKSGFVKRQNRQLIPTKRGIELIKILPESVKSVKLTAKWESELKSIEMKGSGSDEFIKEVTEMVKELIASYENVSANTVLSGREETGRCPRCAKPVYEGKKGFYCSGYKDDPPCGFVIWKNNPYFHSKRKELTGKVVSELLKNGRVSMTGLYSEKKGVFYDADIIMEDTGDEYVRFHLEFNDKKKS